MEALEARTLFAFGVTTGTAPTGQSTYVIDNGGDLKFSVIKGGSVTSTIHMGDVTSIQYKGKEMLATYAETSRYSHYEQGLSSVTVVSYKIVNNGNANDWILVTCDDSATASDATQYYAVRRGDNNIYMASLPSDVTQGPGEGRFIAYLERGVFSTPEAPSDNAGTTGAIEGSDVFGHADGTTTSKFYNMGRRMIDNVYHGLTGSASGTSVGAWMFMGNRETSSGGPFFKDIDFQSSDSQVEMYNCLFTGHTQTEGFRQGLKGPYAMQFTDGSAPTTPDYSWMDALGLQGWTPMSGRGTVTGTASGVPSGHDVVVGLSNGTAQYWVRPDAGGHYTITGVLPGTYTETLYDTELEVGRKTVTISAGTTTGANIVDTFYIPANPIFRIGTWDGTPGGFLNDDKISIMHPSDVRMADWTSTPNFVVGTNTDADWPLAQFMGVNNSQRITFNLTSAQVQALTLRVGITWGFSGARPKITVNSGQTYAWTSANPTASADLNSRGITRGTWRGVNQLYTFNIPSSAFRAGTNTIDLPLISGSYSAGQTWLSPNVAYDAIDLVPTSSASAPTIASVTIAPANPSVGVGQSKTFTAVAKDSSGNVITANIDWSAANGTIDPNGNYVAPANGGSDTITAVANEVRFPGYSTSSSSTSAFTGTISGTGSTGVTVIGPIPAVVTPASASPSPAYGTATTLSVLGTDDGGESNLTYTWSVVGTPPGPVTFSANGTNAAKTTVATFSAGAYGTYSFLVTIRDQQGNSTTSSVSVPYSEKVVWYQNDVSGGTVLPDSSGNNFTATLTGSYNFVPGVSGNAVQLTGGAATLPAGIFSTLTNFTVATWVKLDSLATWSRIFDFGTGTNVYMFLTPQSSTGKPRFAITTSGGAGEQKIDSTVAMATGVWTHVAVTLSGNTATLYINGVARGTNTAVTLRPSSLGNTTLNYIGDSQFSADPSLMGSIDDFRVYPRALSAAEVQALAGGSVSGTVFQDNNASGTYDGSEPPLPGMQVYLDANNNGVLDAGELSTTTGAAGDYLFSSVPVGSYVVREVAPAGYALVSPPGVAVGNGGSVTADLANTLIVYAGSAAGDSYLVRRNAGGQYEILIGGSVAYTLATGTPSLTFNLGGGDDALTLDYSNGSPVPGGGLFFDGSTGANSLSVVGTPAAGATAVSVTGGTVALSAIAPNLALNVTGAGAALAINSPAQLATLNVSNAATATMAAGLTVGGLSVAGNSYVDLNANPLTVSGLSVPALRQYLANHQIISSLADATHVLGYLFAGDIAAPTSLTVRLVQAGDANLDGRLDGDDFALLDKGYATGAGVWWFGDFNYDGQVTVADYLAIDTAYLQQSGATEPTAAMVAAGAAQFGPSFGGKLRAAIRAARAPKPKATITGPAKVQRNYKQTFTFGVATKGAALAKAKVIAPPYRFAIDWNGDGVTDQVVLSGKSTLNLGHVFRAAGRQRVSLSVTTPTGLKLHTTTRLVNVTR